MATTDPIRMGAVIYDPKVTVIWSIIREFFEANLVAMDVSFFADYTLQVDALVANDIDIAWNSPLAWLDTVRRTNGRCRAIAMRDTDRDRVSRFVTNRATADAGVEALRGAALATGARDSPQATLIPLQELRERGLDAGRDFRTETFDIGVGLHGDHVGGELEAFRALERGIATASVMLDLNHDAWVADGTLDPGQFTVAAETGRFDHCNFSVREEFPRDRENRFLEALFSMRYDDPRHREMMDLEGLKQWLPGRTSGYATLERAVEAQGFFEPARS